MRILFFSGIVPYPPHGGVLQRNFNLVRELKRQGADVHLLAFHHPNELPHGAPLEHSKQVLGEFCEAVEYGELWPKKSKLHMLTSLGIAAFSRDPFAVRAHYSPFFARRVRELTASGRFDVVHLDSVSFAPYAQLAHGVPVLCTHQNVESQLFARRAGHERGWLRRSYVARQARVLERLERKTCGRYANNIMVSDDDARTLRGLCPQARTAVIANGVDTEYFTPREGGTEPTLIFTGSMRMFANNDAVRWFLEEIWPAVKARVPNARFIAIGRQPSGFALDYAARDPSVEVPGFVDDVRPWVARAAVYVVPMRVGGGTRLKVLDAMAQGKAIVSTRLGAEGIHMEDGVHYAAADQPRDFAAAITRLLGDAAVRARLGHAARERAESKYSWPALGRQLLEVYAQAARNARTVSSTQDSLQTPAGVGNP
jgi:sugar transferase (PEP-CTERM/EpsH1 system associated)